MTIPEIPPSETSEFDPRAPQIRLRKLFYEEIRNDDRFQSILELAGVTPLVEPRLSAADAEDFGSFEGWVILLLPRLVIPWFEYRLGELYCARGEGSHYRTVVPFEKLPKPPRGARSRWGTRTVGELRALFEHLSDDTPVVLAGGSDHTYRPVRESVVALAGFTPSVEFFEWYGPQNASTGEEPVTALVLGS